MNWYWHVIIALVVFIACLIWLMVWLWREKWCLEDELVNSEYSRVHDQKDYLDNMYVADERYQDVTLERDRAHRMVAVLLDEISKHENKRTASLNRQAVMIKRSTNEEHNQGRTDLRKRSSAGSSSGVDPRRVPRLQGRRRQASRAAAGEPAEAGG